MSVESRPLNSPPLDLCVHMPNISLCAQSDMSDTHIDSGPPLNSHDETFGDGPIPFLNRCASFVCDGFIGLLRPLKRRAPLLRCLDRAYSATERFSTDP
jgi:hypothetical protein